MAPQKRSKKTSSKTLSKKPTKKSNVRLKTALPKPLPWHESPEFKAAKGTQRAFLIAFSYCGVVGQSAAVAEVDRTMHNYWLQRDPAYPPLFELAKEAATDLLETEARRRAVDGSRKYVFHQGEPVLHPETGEPYFELTHSDRLMELLLKADRKKFGDNSKVTLTGTVKNEVSGPDGGQVEVSLDLESLGLTLEVKRALLDALEKRAKEEQNDQEANQGQTEQEVRSSPPAS